MDQMVTDWPAATMASGGRRQWSTGARMQRGRRGKELSRRTISSPGARIRRRQGPRRPDGDDSVRARRRPAARWSSSTSPLGASQLDSLDGVVEDDAAERLDISPGLGEAGDGPWQRHGPRRVRSTAGMTAMMCSIPGALARFCGMIASTRGGGDDGFFGRPRGGRHRRCSAAARAAAGARPDLGFRGGVRVCGRREGAEGSAASYPRAAKGGPGDVEGSTATAARARQ